MYHNIRRDRVTKTDWYMRRWHLQAMIQTVRVIRLGAKNTMYHVSLRRAEHPVLAAPSQLCMSASERRANTA